MSFTAAASNIAAILSRKLPSSGGAFASGGSCPWARACRRHLHGGASAFPATGANCRNGTAFGACIRFKYRGAAFNWVGKVDPASRPAKNPRPSRANGQRP